MNSPRYKNPLAAGRTRRTTGTTAPKLPTKRLTGPAYKNRRLRRAAVTEGKSTPGNTLTGPAYKNARFRRQR